MPNKIAERIGIVSVNSVSINVSVKRNTEFFIIGINKKPAGMCISAGFAIHKNIELVFAVRFTRLSARKISRNWGVSNSAWTGKFFWMEFVRTHIIIVTTISTFSCSCCNCQFVYLWCQPIFFHDIAPFSYKYINRLFGR